ncbi:transcriptional SWT1-like [Paramuricea clavata]|uniref:Transcriptional protein SWT1 n=1 Tax=Paramuricea clavata TaxID=317549 RepID=A0A6S7G3W2_PARCT|nr:transcriptional SWT1-like [Paramuricea clavata]
MSAKDLKEAAKGLPNNWEVFHSKKSKRLYYYNNETKKTQWHHPSLGERNKHGEKSKSKKRKASGDERNKVKHEKGKQSFKQQYETKQEQIPVKLKKDQTNCDASKLPEKLFLNALPKAKATEKPFLKALPKLPSKSHTGNFVENTKRSAHDQKPYTESVKNNTQASKPCNETAQTNTRTFNSAKSNPQANELGNRAVKADLEITNSVNPSGKTNSQAFKTLKEQKVPVLLKSKSQSEAKKIPKLQPLLRTKSLGEGSDSGVSESSDRILAWLADTSRINFKNHPVPTITVEEDKVSSMKQAKQTSARIIGKQKSERQKATIIERVETNSGTAEPKSDILDKLLPKHSQTHAKQRHAPYKLNLTDLKHNKTNSSQIELEKGLSGQTTAKATTSSTTKISPANQNGLSSELANSFARNLSGKTTADQNRFLVSETAASENLIESLFGVDDNNVPPIASVQNVNLPSENSLQNGLDEPQQLVSSAVIQGHSEVFDNVQPDDDVFSMEEGVGSDVSIPLSESEVADMEIDNAEELAKEIVQELKEMRGSIVVQPSQIHKDNQMAMKVSSDGYEGVLYIVLDTNVLLSHLKFVTELKDFPIPGVGMPILVIPWVVIQELDSLKENKWRSHESGDKATRVDMLARVAIKFLNSSFHKSDPRVRGQTVDEAAEHVGNLQQEMNDDQILQCCLLFHQRAQNGSCVLFSNDVNLCNKAMVNGIKAFNHEKLLPGLKDLFQCGAMVKQHSEEYNTQLVIEEDQARRRQKIILREGLSYIIENEMKKAYDDLW